jgi:hypothetical protein
MTLELVPGSDYLLKDAHLSGNCDFCGSVFPDLWLAGTYVGTWENTHRFFLQTPFICKGCGRMVRVLNKLETPMNVSNEFDELRNK